MPKNAPSTDFTVESWPIDKPKPYDKNARVIPKAAVEKVAESIKQYGFRQAIVVDTKGVIIAGHTRLQAAKMLGLETVPVHVAVGLSPAKVKAYRIADNRTNEETSWNYDVLAEELAGFKGDQEDIAAMTGFDMKELEDIIKSTPTEEHPPTAQHKKPTSAVQAKKGASKIVHVCPSCGHSWHSGDPPSSTVDREPSPFGAAPVDA